MAFNNQTIKLNECCALFSNKVMLNVRNSSVITYIKYLRISIAALISYRITLARAAKTVGSDWTCSTVRELLTLIQ